MKKTIIITGASSGIGNATASYFANSGWQVFATMRNIKHFNTLNSDVIPLELDVTNVSSIQNCLQIILTHTNKIDAIVNNAGYGGFGAFELSNPQQRQDMYDVNVFGLMNVIQQILPHFRENRKGIIVNISSIGGLMTYPLFSVYHSTKWAVEGFTESIYYELKQLGIKVKLVEPGATKSDFATRSMVFFSNTEIDDYQDYQERLQQKVSNAFKKAPEPIWIAKGIFEAVKDNSDKLRYPIGNRRSMTILRLRNVLPTTWFMKLISISFGK
jgi:short-subunit dehydrogenase